MREAVKKNANSNESEFFRSDRIFNDAFTRPKVIFFNDCCPISREHVG